MNKKVIITICIVILILIIGAFAWIKLNNTFDKSNPIIFEKGSNDNYSYVIYQNKEYVPYSACSPKDRTKYLGYIKDDEQNEIYTFKNYSEEEWLINLLDTGATKECMLYKEKNVTNIPEGLSSEYEWNN